MLDSLLVVRQVCGTWACRSPSLEPYYSDAMRMIETMETSGRHIIVKHVYREFNKVADGLVNTAVDSRSSKVGMSRNKNLEVELGRTGIRNMAVPRWVGRNTKLARIRIMVTSRLWHYCGGNPNSLTPAPTALQTHTGRLRRIESHQIESCFGHCAELNTRADGH